MCDDILINVFVCLYTCQIFLYFCINLYKSCIYLYLYSKMEKYRYFCLIYLWRMFFFVAHHFLWRTKKQCATECLCIGVLPSYFCGALHWVRHKKFHFLWRTTWVRHRNNFSGENSVAHPANLGVRHRIPKPCATNRRFCTSVSTHN